MTDCGTQAQVYVGQTELALDVTIVDQDGAAVDLADATVSMKYRAPSGASGEWTVTVTDVAGGQVRWIPADASSLNEAGAWTLWPHVQFASTGRALAATPYTLRVLEEGRVAF